MIMSTERATHVRRHDLPGAGSPKQAPNKVLLHVLESSHSAVWGSGLSLYGCTAAVSTACHSVRMRTGAHRLTKLVVNRALHPPPPLSSNLTS
jgi:hypothetical protein